MNTYFDYEELLNARARLKEVFKDPSVVRQSRYFLRSGDEASFFFDFDIITNNPNKCADIVAVLASEINQIVLSKKIDYIAFIEKRSGATVGAIRLAAAISMETGISNLVVRLNKDLIFERTKLPVVSGIPAWQKLKGAQLILITDHVSQGREIIQAVNSVESLGAKLTDIVTYTLKPLDVKDKMDELFQRDIIVHSVFDIFDLKNKGNHHYDVTSGGIKNAREEANIPSRLLLSN